MKKIIVFLIPFSLLFLSCEEEEQEVQISQKQILLVSKPWFIKSWIVSFNGEVSDQLKDNVACDKDDSYSFQNDGNWVLNVGNVKCNWGGADPTNYKGTWKLIENDTKLALSEWSATSGHFDIDELTENSLVLVLNTSGTINNGLTPYIAKATITFSH